jgi:molybdate transport repressor ModE-like protein
MSVGGSGGGGARLTDLGREIVKAYREIEDAAEKAAVARINWLVSRRKATRRGASGRRPMTPSARKPHAARK